MMTKKMTRFLQMFLWMTLFFEAAELDAIALLADTRNDGVATRQHLSTSPKNHFTSSAVLEDINLEKMERHPSDNES